MFVTSYIIFTSDEIRKKFNYVDHKYLNSGFILIEKLNSIENIKFLLLSAAFVQQFAKIYWQVIDSSQLSHIYRSSFFKEVLMNGSFQHYFFPSALMQAGIPSSTFPFRIFYSLLVFKIFSHIFLQSNSLKYFL